MHISHNMQSDPAPPTVVIFGCGNVLLGDDGFGPAVIEQLCRAPLPDPVRAIDVGTSIREQLLDYLLLPATRPGLLIVVDAGLEEDGPAGEVRRCRPRDLPRRKIHDFSLHQFPTVNLLAELETETGIEVVLLLARSAFLPERVAPGLSPAMRIAVDTACAHLRDLIASPVPSLTTAEAAAP
jgi:coenzyme F420 hydrogenase subunit delta